MCFKFLLESIQTNSSENKQVKASEPRAKKKQDESIFASRAEEEVAIQMAAGTLAAAEVSGALSKNTEVQAEAIAVENVEAQAEVLAAENVEAQAEVVSTENADENNVFAEAALATAGVAATATILMTSDDGIISETEEIAENAENMSSADENVGSTETVEASADKDTGSVETAEAIEDESTGNADTVEASADADNEVIAENIDNEDEVSGAIESDNENKEDGEEENHIAEVALATAGVAAAATILMTSDDGIISETEEITENAEMMSSADENVGNADAIEASADENVGSVETAEASANEDTGSVENGEVSADEDTGSVENAEASADADNEVIAENIDNEDEVSGDIEPDNENKEDGEEENHIAEAALAAAGVAAVGAATVGAAAMMAHSEEASSEETPSDGAPSDKTLSEETPSDKTLSEETPSDKASSDNISAEDDWAYDDEDDSLQEKDNINAEEEDSDDKKGLALLFANLAARIGTAGAAILLIAALLGLFGLAGFAGLKLYNHFNTPEGNEVLSVADNRNDDKQKDESKADDTLNLESPDGTIYDNDASDSKNDSDGKNDSDNLQIEDINDGQSDDESVNESSGNASEKTDSNNTKKPSSRNDRLKAEANKQEEELQNQMLVWLQALLNANEANRNKNVYAYNDTEVSNSSSSSDSNKDRNKKSSSKKDNSQSEKDKASTKTEKKNAKAGTITPYSLQDSFAENVVIKKNNLSSRVSENLKKYTVMLYLCGSDLENRDGSSGANASIDVVNSILSCYNTENMNVVVCAGGSKDWRTAYFDELDNNGLGFYYINSSKLSDELIASYDAAASSGNFNNQVAEANKILNACVEKLVVYTTSDNAGIDMGNSSILAGFMDLCYDYFPASDYGLILNNHGGSITGGVCSSEVENTKSITASKLEEAIRASKIYASTTNDKALDFVTFDACLMGGVEMAYNLSAYCDYVVGSSEVELGSINYREVFANISKDVTGNRVLSKNIAEYFVQSAYDEKTGGDNVVQTFACIDTKKAVESQKYIEVIADNLCKLYEINNKSKEDMCYTILKDARIHSMYYGAGDSMDDSFDVVDIRQFFGNISQAFSTEMGKEEDEELLAIYSEIVGNINSLLNIDMATLSFTNYGGEKLYFNGSTNSGIDKSVYNNWYKILDKSGEAIDLGAVSIFFPMYSSKIVDGKIVNNSDFENYNNDLFKNYEKLVELQIKKYESLKNDENSSLNKLILAVNSVDYPEIAYVKTNSEEKKYGLYSEIFSQAGEDSGQSLLTTKFKNDNGTYKDVEILHVQAEKNYTDSQLASHNEYEGEGKEGSIFANPFSDFMDTVKKLEVYISRRQESSPGYGYDIVYGKEEISLSSISGANESVDVNINSLGKAIGYQVSYIKAGAAAVEEYFHDWGFLKAKNEKNENIANTQYIFEGRVGKRSDTGESVDVYANLIFEEDEEGNITFSKANVFENDENGDCVERGLDSLRENYSYIEFNHYIISEGQLVAINNLDLVDNNAEKLDNLRMSLSNEIKISKTNLVDDTNYSKYNDYTLGIVYDEEDSNKVYILDSGNAHGEEYNDYTSISNIGNSNVITTLDNSNIDSESIIVKSMKASDNVHEDTLTLMIADTYADRIINEANSNEASKNDGSNDNSENSDSKLVADNDNFATLELKAFEKNVTANLNEAANAGNDSSESSGNEEKKSDKKDSDKNVSEKNESMQALAADDKLKDAVVLAGVNDNGSVGIIVDGLVDVSDLVATDNSSEAEKDTKKDDSGEALVSDAVDKNAGSTETNSTDVNKKEVINTEENNTDVIKKDADSTEASNADAGKNDVDSKNDTSDSAINGISSDNSEASIESATSDSSADSEDNSSKEAASSPEDCGSPVDSGASEDSGSPEEAGSSEDGGSSDDSGASEEGSSSGDEGSTENEGGSEESSDSESAGNS